MPSLFSRVGSIRRKAKQQHLNTNVAVVEEARKDVNGNASVDGDKRVGVGVVAATAAAAVTAANLGTNAPPPPPPSERANTSHVSKANPSISVPPVKSPDAPAAAAVDPPLPQPRVQHTASNHYESSSTSVQGANSSFRVIRRDTAVLPPAVPKNIRPNRTPSVHPPRQQQQQLHQQQWVRRRGPMDDRQFGHPAAAGGYYSQFPPPHSRPGSRGSDMSRRDGHGPAAMGRGGGWQGQGGPPRAVRQDVANQRINNYYSMDGTPPDLPNELESNGFARPGRGMSRDAPQQAYPDFHPQELLPPSLDSEGKNPPFPEKTPPQAFDGAAYSQGPTILYPPRTGSSNGGYSGSQTPTTRQSSGIPTPTSRPGSSARAHTSGNSPWPAPSSSSETSSIATVTNFPRLQNHVYSMSNSGNGSGSIPEEGSQNSLKPPQSFADPPSAPGSIRSLRMKVPTPPRRNVPLMKAPEADDCNWKDFTVVQTKCLMGHRNMKRIGNWHHKVVCMVCRTMGSSHTTGSNVGAEDEGERWRWLCSWCAVRICSACKQELHESCRGDLQVLLERVAKRKSKGGAGVSSEAAVVVGNAHESSFASEIENRWRTLATSVDKRWSGMSRVSSKAPAAPPVSDYSPKTMTSEDKDKDAQANTSAIGTPLQPSITGNTLDALRDLPGYKSSAPSQQSTLQPSSEHNNDLTDGNSFFASSKFMDDGRTNSLRSTLLPPPSFTKLPEIQGPYKGVLEMNMAVSSAPGINGVKSKKEGSLFSGSLKEGKKGRKKWFGWFGPKKEVVGV
ncbi:hypothetical protein RUND412_002915 [Rhizina undulata]